MTMTTMMPEGEDIRRAIKWISGRREEAPELPLASLIEEAVFQFDLSPLDQEFLTGFFRKRKAP
ncbi:MAG: hypothetical protein ACYDAA_00100 [Syntrophales bacterium]